MTLTGENSFRLIANVVKESFWREINCDFFFVFDYIDRRSIILVILL